MTVGFAICGSFCTHSRVIPAMSELKNMGNDIIPIMSETAYSTDTRFGKAADFIDAVEQLCGKRVLHTISETEPIGPKRLLDCMIISPCTGNTLSKIAYGITDTSVTMAAKAHLRNDRPLVIAVATNDALSGSAVSIGTLLNRRNIFFVPMSQDDPLGKPRSMIAHFDILIPTVSLAAEGKQIQPIYV